MKFDMNSFDCIYVINLDHRTDRLKSIDEQFNKINVKYKRFSAIKEKDGSNGCRLSHLAILKEAKENNFKKILICEDDLVLRKKIVEDIDGIVQSAKDCDMLYFNHHYFGIDSKEYAVKHAAPWCTHMYAVFNIDNVLSWVIKNNTEKRTIDSIYVSSRLNCYVTSKEYAFQLPSKSDITGRFENYFSRLISNDDLLLEKEDISRSYKRFFDVTNPIFILEDVHDGMGDVLLFLSKVVEVANYYKQKTIKLSSKNRKISLMKELIPMIANSGEFQITNEEPNVLYDWWDFGDTRYYCDCKDQFKWKPNSSNCITYQLNGANCKKELKNHTDEDILYFCLKFKRYVTIDVNKIFNLNSKVNFLKNSERYYGIDSGNTHLAGFLGVPTTIIKNKYLDTYLTCFEGCEIKGTIFDLKCDPYEKFNEIYKTGGWEGVGSGPGSNPNVNREYLQVLDDIINKDKTIKTIVDIGCGDFQLMKEFKHSKKYIGIDTSPFIIEKNKSLYPDVNFECRNMVTDELPNGDIAIIKDVLQHMPNGDIIAVLNKLSKYKMVIITNDYAEFNFDDTVVGSWRGLNLFAAPFRMTGIVLLNYIGKQVVLINN